MFFQDGLQHKETVHWGGYKEFNGNFKGATALYVKTSHFNNYFTYSSQFIAAGHGGTNTDTFTKRRISSLFLIMQVDALNLFNEPKNDFAFIWLP